MAENENVSAFMTHCIMNNLQRTVTSSVVKVEEIRSVEKEHGNKSNVLWNQVEKIDNTILLASSPGITPLGSHEIIPGKDMKFPYDMPSIFSDIVNARDKNDIVEDTDGFKVT